MQIIYYNGFDSSDHGALLQELLAAQLPKAELRVWQPGDLAPADYAVVWKAPAAMLAGRNDLKAIFNLGAGVDAIMALNQQISAHVPVIRLEDAGMGEQMADYVSHAVLGYFRQFGLYRQQARQAIWDPKRPQFKRDFRVALLGLGVLGGLIAQRLLALGFPVSGWSRQLHALKGVRCHAGPEGLNDCLADARVLVCILPLTPDTRGILNQDTLGRLPHGAFLINLGRGAHLVEQDLPGLLRSGQIGGATLDVFQTEPLPASHPFWSEPNLTITPHIWPQTLLDDAHRQIAGKLQRLELGQPVSGVIDRQAGY